MESARARAGAARLGGGGGANGSGGCGGGGGTADSGIANGPASSIIGGVIGSTGSGDGAEGVVGGGAGGRSTRSGTAPTGWTREAPLDLNVTVTPPLTVANKPSSTGLASESALPASGPSTSSMAA